MDSEFQPKIIEPNGKAVIYCRVSSDKQKREGNGISSQEVTCRDFGKVRGLEVIRVFRDEAYSGFILDRPEIQALIEFLRTQKPGTTVITEDVSRIARNVETYILLKNAIMRNGGILLTIKQSFENTPEGLFMERVVTAQAEYDRNNNTRRVKTRQHARLLQGYWCFAPFFGYSYGYDPARGKVLMPDGWNATLATTALSNFASGQFQRVRDVQNYINETGGIEKTRGRDRGRKGFCSFQVAEAIIRNAWFYAGFLEHKGWKITRREGQHQALISIETCQRIEERLNEKNAPKYGKRNEDFPLRGIVECAACGKLLTSCWSGGRHYKYAYYYCTNENCIFRSKIIKRDLMHAQFEVLLASLTPYPEMIEFTKATMQRLWENRIADHERMRKDWERELSAIKSEKLSYVKSFKDAPADMREMIHDEFSRLAERQAWLEQKIAYDPLSEGSFDHALGQALRLISNPRQMWQEGSLDRKRIVQNLIFPSRLSYVWNVDFQKPELALPFSLLQAESEQKDGLVEVSGIEPLTSCLQSKCSTN